MKKLLSLLVCFGLAIGMASVVGCGDAKKDDKPKTPAADSTKEKAKDKDK